MSASPKRWSPRSRVLMTPLDAREAVLLDLDTMTYFSLNETALVLWRAIEQAPKTTGELVELVVRSFEVSEPTAENDVRSVLSKLSEESLVVEIV